MYTAIEQRYHGNQEPVKFCLTLIFISQLSALHSLVLKISVSQYKNNSSKNPAFEIHILVKVAYRSRFSGSIFIYNDLFYIVVLTHKQTIPVTASSNTNTSQKLMYHQIPITPELNFVLADTFTLDQQRMCKTLNIISL